MKHASGIGMELLVGAALSLALGATSSAQLARQGDLVRDGRAVSEGSLENDILWGPSRAPRPDAWAEAQVSLAKLELSFRLMGNDQIDPYAVSPLPSDLNKVLTLAGGKAGSAALIEVGLVSESPVVRHPALYPVAVFTGTFDPAGEFTVVLPPDLDLRGLGARGAQSPSRMRSAIVNFDEVMDEAFASWDELYGLSRPQAAGAGGRRVMQPNRRAGHSGQAQINHRSATREVDLEPRIIRCPPELPLPEEEIRAEKIYDIAPPKRAGLPGSMEKLRPSHRGGHIG